MNVPGPAARDNSRGDGHAPGVYDFDKTLSELERFLGHQAEARSTFSEVGGDLPPGDGAVVTLLEVAIVTEGVTRGRTRVERATPTRARFLRLVGDGFVWRVPAEGYEGSWWDVPDHTLHVSSGVGAFVLTVDEPLPAPPYDYELELMQLDGISMPPKAHRHKRPLVVGEQFLRAEDGPWIAVEIDAEVAPPRALCRRPWDES